MALRSLMTITSILIATATFAVSRDTVRTYEPRPKKEVMFKTDRTFLGGTVEILAANGAVLTSSSLQRRKMVVDFGEAMAGTYIIRVRKGNDLKEFLYFNNE
jgi:hypothetical protein